MVSLITECTVSYTHLDVYKRQELGPYEEKEELAPVEVTAPIVKTFSLSAGVMM